VIASAADDQAALKRAQVDWLRTMRWDWFATPTFADPTSPSRALQAVERWLASNAFRDPRVKPSLWVEPYAAVGLQRGPMGDRLHVHAVIGGTGRRPLRESLLRGSWRLGDLDLQGYSPARGGIEYLVRQADTVELLGAPLPYRPRRTATL